MENNSVHDKVILEKAKLELNLGDEWIFRDRMGEELTAYNLDSNKYIVGETYNISRKGNQIIKVYDKTEDTSDIEYTYYNDMPESSYDNNSKDIIMNVADKSLGIISIGISIRNIVISVIVLVILLTKVKTDGNMMIEMMILPFKLVLGIVVVKELIGLVIAVMSRGNKNIENLEETKLYKFNRVFIKIQDKIVRCLVLLLLFTFLICFDYLCIKEHKMNEFFVSLLFWLVGIDLLIETFFRKKKK